MFLSRASSRSDSRVRCSNHAIVGDYQLVLTDYIIEEVREHILRLKPEDITRLDQTLTDANCELAPEPLPDEEAANQDIVRDRADIPMVLAAINAKVDFLVSQDKDITDHTQPVHQHLKIILPGAFLREHMGWTSEALEAVSTAE